MLRFARGVVGLACAGIALGAPGCGDDAGDASGGAGDDAGTLDASVDGDAGADGDAGPDASVETGAPDADAAACVGDAAYDAPPVAIDAGSALTFFDTGGLDLRLDLSSDGRLALIEDGATLDVWLYDTLAGTLEKRTHVAGDATKVQATSLSGDGTRIGALHGASAVVGGVWDACRGWVDLASTHAAGCAGPPDDVSGVFGLNADGTVAVGDAWDLCVASAMRWTEANGAWTPTPLQHLGVAGGSERATVVSDDGAVIGGFAQREGADRSPAVWRADGTGTLLDPSGTVVGEVLAVSADGTMVAGPWNTVTDAGDALNGAFYWTASDGVVQVGTLPSPQAQDQVWITAIAAQRRLLLGSAGDPSWAFDLNGTEEFAVAWTAAAGMRKLQDLVAAEGIALPAGYDLTGVSAASADGTVVLGFATDMNDPNLRQHTFVLRVPVSAYGL